MAIEVRPDSGQIVHSFATISIDATQFIRLFADIWHRAATRNDRARSR